MDNLYSMRPQGWESLIANLRADLHKIAPGLHVTEISVASTGRLQFNYSGKGLSARQQAAVDARVKRAEDTAWETCVVCGKHGRLAYNTEPLRARVVCPKHTPKDWQTLD